MGKFSRGTFSPIALQQMLLAQAEASKKDLRKDIMVAILDADPKPLSIAELLSVLGQGLYKQEVADLIRICRSSNWLQAILRNDTINNTRNRCYGLTPRGKTVAQQFKVTAQ